MKEFILGLFILVLAYFALNFFNNTSSIKQLDLNAATIQCSKNLDVNQCSIDKIQSIIKASTNSPFSKKDHSHIIWTADNKLVDLYGTFSNEIILNTSELSYHQKLVWNSYLIDSKKKQGNTFMNENNIVGFVVIIIYVLAALWIVFAVVPFIWKFFLNRVAEVSKAAKGEKVD